jgi:hypothetical protein
MLTAWPRDHFLDGVGTGKAFCAFHFEVPRSVITVQREFRARFKKDIILV